MRIMFIVRSLQLAGAERQLANLAIGLSKRGHSVAIAILYAKYELREEIQNHGVEFFCLNKRSTWDNVIPLFRLHRYIRIFRPEIIHGYGTIPNCFAALFGVIRTSCQCVFGIRSGYMNYRYYGLSAVFFRKLEMFLSRFSDLVIANSYSGKEFLISDGCAEDKIKVIHNGIDTERFRPNLIYRQQCRELLGLNDKQLLVGIVGRYDYMKDHQNYFQAMLSVMQKNNQVYSVSIGNGEQKLIDSYQNYVAEQGDKNRFLWMMSQPKIEKWMNAIDILVSSSRGEGFSNVIAEAMSCNIPVIATDVGDAKYIVTNMSRLVPTNNSIALGQAISQLIESLNNSNTQSQEREKILKSFSFDNLIINTEATLYRLTKKT